MSPVPPLSPARLVVAGGHSAGHIEPAMNFADAVRRLEPAAEITALGTERGLDTTLIPARGYPLELIPPVPLPRRPGRALVAAPGRLRAAVRAAAAVLERTGAEVVVGFGGYVAMPAYLAARRRRLPIVVHEANARPGVANRVAARLTRYVFTASPAVRLPHALPIGIPLRPAIARLDRPALRAAARERFGLAAGRPGTAGDRRLAGRPADQRRGRRGRPGSCAPRASRCCTSPGRSNTRRRAERGQPPYVVVPYVDEMDYAYAAADFVLCRSGAMTCAELAAVGLPAAYVPLPLRGGEQRLNAEPIVAAGGGLMVGNDELSPEWIVREVIPRVERSGDRCSRWPAPRRRAGARDADAVLARHVLEIVAERRAVRA